MVGRWVLPSTDRQGIRGRGAVRWQLSDPCSSQLFRPELEADFGWELCLAAANWWSPVKILAEPLAACDILLAFAREVPGAT